MKKSYVGKLISITKDSGKKYSIIPKEDFDELLKQGITRKKARQFNIGSTIWNNSSNYHYTPKELEEQRVNKMRTTNSLKRYEQWEDNLQTLENLSPGISSLFKDNLRNNPEIIMDEIERLSDMFHEMKLFIKQSKKYIRQSCKRKGIPYKKMVANSSEYLLKKTLKELGFKPIVQPYMNKLWYDFLVGNTLIELDGSNYHTDERDEYKNEIAIKSGYDLLRINCDELNDLETLKIKLKTCLHKVK